MYLGAKGHDVCNHPQIVLKKVCVWYVCMWHVSVCVFAHVYMYVYCPGREGMWQGCFCLLFTEVNPQNIAQILSTQLKEFFQIEHT